MPARRERTGLGLAVADHARNRQVGVVEGGAEGMREGVAELAPLVDRAGRLGRGVARDAARERELAEEALQPGLVAADLGEQLAVGALEVGVGDHARPAVPGARDVEDVPVTRADEPVQMRPDQVQAGRGAPVAEQARLDVLGGEWLAQQRVVEQVDLPDREVVRGAPPCVDALELLTGERAGRRSFGGGHAGSLAASRPGLRGTCDRVVAGGQGWYAACVGPNFWLAMLSPTPESARMPPHLCGNPVDAGSRQNGK